MLFDYYNNRRSIAEVLNTRGADLGHLAGRGAPKKLIQGDNLAVLRTLLDDSSVAGKVKLVYIDPPFATNGHFRIGKYRG